MYSISSLAGDIVQGLKDLVDRQIVSNHYIKITGPVVVAILLQLIFTSTVLMESLPITTGTVMAAIIWQLKLQRLSWPRSYVVYLFLSPIEPSWGRSLVFEITSSYVIIPRYDLTVVAAILWQLKLDLFMKSLHITTKVVISIPTENYFK